MTEHERRESTEVTSLTTCSSRKDTTWTGQPGVRRVNETSHPERGCLDSSSSGPPAVPGSVDESMDVPERRKGTEVAPLTTYSSRKDTTWTG